MTPFASIDIPIVPASLADPAIANLARRLEAERDHILAEIERIGSSRSLTPAERYPRLRALGDQARDLFSKVQSWAKDAGAVAGERAASSVDTETIRDAREAQRLAGSLADVARRMHVESEHIYRTPAVAMLDATCTGRQLLDAARGMTGETAAPRPAPAPASPADFHRMSGRELLDLARPAGTQTTSS